MKKRILIITILILLLIGGAVTAVLLLDTDGDLPNGDIVIPDEETAEVRLDKTTLLLQIGNSQLLQVLGTNERATFASADPKTATVDENGTVQAVSVGQTEITCRIGDDTLACTIFVCSKGTPTEMFLAPDTDEFTAALGNSVGYAGEYVAITLYLYNKAELSGFSLSLSYDKDALTLCKADFMGTGIDGGEVYDDQTGKLTLAALSHKTNGIATSDQGAVPTVMLVFKISKDAKGDTKLTPQLMDGDMFVSVKDGNEVLLTPRLFDGKIEIKE